MGGMFTAPASGSVGKITHWWQMLNDNDHDREGWGAPGKFWAAEPRLEIYGDPPRTDKVG